MNPKFRSLAILFLLTTLALVNLASRLSAPVFQDAAPTPTVTLPAAGVAGQPEVTNGIAFLGILIFAVIVFAIGFRIIELHAIEAKKR